MAKLKGTGRKAFLETYSDIKSKSSVVRGQMKEFIPGYTPGNGRGTCYQRGLDHQLPVTTPKGYKGDLLFASNEMQLLRMTSAVTADLLILFGVTMAEDTEPTPERAALLGRKMADSEAEISFVAYDGEVQFIRKREPTCVGLVEVINAMPGEFGRWWITKAFYRAEFSYPKMSNEGVTPSIIVQDSDTGEAGLTLIFQLTFSNGKNKGALYVGRKSYRHDSETKLNDVYRDVLEGLEALKAKQRQIVALAGKKPFTQSRLYLGKKLLSSLTTEKEAEAQKWHDASDIFGQIRNIVIGSMKGTDDYSPLRQSMIAKQVAATVDNILSSAKPNTSESLLEAFMVTSDSEEE